MSTIQISSAKKRTSTTKPNYAGATTALAALVGSGEPFAGSGAGKASEHRHAHER